MIKKYYYALVDVDGFCKVGDRLVVSYVPYEDDITITVGNRPYGASGSGFKRCSMRASSLRAETKEEALTLLLGGGT